MEKKKYHNNFFCFSEVELIPRKWYTYTSIFQMYLKKGLVNTNGTADFSFTTARNKAFRSFDLCDRTDRTSF